MPFLRLLAHAFFFSGARNIHYEDECVFIPSHQGPPRVCLLSSLQSEMVKYQKWWKSYKASEIPVFLIPFLSEIRRLLGWFLMVIDTIPLFETSGCLHRAPEDNSMGHQGEDSEPPGSSSSLRSSCRNNHLVPVFNGTLHFYLHYN